MIPSQRRPECSLVSRDNPRVEEPGVLVGLSRRKSRVQIPSRGPKLVYQARWRSHNRQKLRDASRARRQRFKNEALARYGKACGCGFSDSRALQIDHIAENGAAERKNLGGQNFSGWRFYEWLKKRGWPDGYQTMCANCNLIKYFSRRGDQ